MKRIISIIGGGIGGLAAGCRLAAQGHRVTIYERNATPGGKAAGIKIENYWVDSAPTILRMPHLVLDLFSTTGGDNARLPEIFMLDTHYRFYQAGTNIWFETTPRPQTTKDNIASISRADAENYDEFLNFSRQTYKSQLAAVPYTNPPGRINSAIIKIFSGTPSTTPLSPPFYRTISHYFKNPLIRHAFGYFPLFFGQNPFTAPASYAMLHSMEQQWGIGYPVGGMRHLVNQLTALFQSLGGTIALNTSVASIDVHHTTIQKIRLSSGGLIQTDYIISDLSPYQTIQKLVLHKSTTEKIQNTNAFGNSHVIMHFICKRLAFRDALRHHNFILSDAFNESIQAIFRRGNLPGSLNLYMCVPTISDSTLLPPELDLLIVVMPAPNLQSSMKWREESLPVQSRIINTIEQVFPGFQHSIIHQNLTHPKHLAEDYGIDWGSNFVPSKRLPIEKLYYSGENAWQGLGLVGIFSSAEAISREIARLES